MPTEKLIILLDAQDKASSKLSGVDKKLAAVQQRAGQMGAALKQTAIALATVTAAVTVATVKAFADFDTAMRNVWTLLPVGKSQIDELAKSVENLSKVLPQSAEEMGASLYDIVSAGITNTAEAMQVLELSSKAAVAGLTDAKNASKGAISIMNAFGKSTAEIPKIFDIMFSTVRVGITTFPEISESVGRMATQFGAAGASIEEMLGSLAFLTRMGLNSQQSVTRLARAMQSLIANSDKMKDFGAPVFDAAGKFRGLEAIVSDLQVSLAGLTDEQQLKKMKDLIPQQRAAQAIQAMVNNYDKFKQTLDDVADSHGAMESAASKQLDSFNNRVKVLTNNFNVFMVGVGAELSKILLPQIQDLTDNLAVNGEKWKNDVVPVLEAMAQGFVKAGEGAVFLLGATKTLATGLGQTVAWWEKVLHGGAQFREVMEMDRKAALRLSDAIEDKLLFDLEHLDPDLQGAISLFDKWKQAMPLDILTRLAPKIAAARSEVESLTGAMDEAATASDKAGQSKLIGNLAGGDDEAGPEGAGPTTPDATASFLARLDKDTATKRLALLNDVLLTEKQKVQEAYTERHQIAVDALRADAISAEKFISIRAKLEQAEANELLALTAKTSSAWEKLWTDALDRFASGVGQSVADAVLSNESFAESTAKMVNQIKGQLIATIVEVAIKRLVAAALGGNLLAVGLLIGGAVAALNALNTQQAQAGAPATASAQSQPPPSMGTQPGAQLAASNSAASQSAPVSRSLTVNLSGPVFLRDREDARALARWLAPELERVEARAA